jgi:arginyl-tRNA--protein-N-Asp/Glu arginylyltransferase
VKQRNPGDGIHFYAGPTHQCGYHPDRTARSLYVDPYQPPGKGLYDQLIEHGFRRSGNLIYRHQCPTCNACRSLRVDVNQHQPTRSERRLLRRNSRLTVHHTLPLFSDEVFELYCRYQSSRHPGGGMENPTPGEFLAFLSGPWCQTEFIEFREDRRVLAVAVVDRLASGLSAVYTFFDPEESRRSLGSLAILWQIAEAKRLGQRWLYLGYWIESSEKMAYKSRFRPAQILGEDGWQWLGACRTLDESAAEAG